MLEFFIVSGTYNLTIFTISAIVSKYFTYRQYLLSYF